jgi:hypothetical protein
LTREVSRAYTIHILEDGSKEDALNLSYWFEQGWVWDDDYKGQTTILGLRYQIETVSTNPIVKAFIREKQRGNNTFWYLDLYTNVSDQSGTDTFRIKVMDAGKDMGFNTPDDLYAYSNDFDVVVDPTNDRPYWNLFETGSGFQKMLSPSQKNLVLTEQEAGCREDSQYKFMLSCEDKDGDFIEYSCSDDRVTIKPDLLDPQSKSEFYITPTNDDIPFLNLTIHADDFNGGTREINITIPVTNVNDIPVFVSVNGNEIDPDGDVATFQVNETESIRFIVEAMDIDMGDVMTLESDSDRPVIKKMDPTHWNISVQTTKDDASVGNIFFSLRLLDREKSFPATLDIDIEVQNIQDRPRWTKTLRADFWAYYDYDDPNEWETQNPETARPEWGEPVTFEAYASDIDGDILNYTWRFNGKGDQNLFFRYGSKAIYSFQPTDGNLSRKQNEEWVVNITVTDGHTTPLYYQFSLVVWSDDDNDNDGLPDMREKFFWGDLSAEPDEDPDGDGYTNYIEIGFENTRFPSEMTGQYSIDRNQMNPLDPEVRPGQSKPSGDDSPEQESDGGVNIPTWVIITVSIVVAIIVAGAVAILVIIRVNKILEDKEEEEIERKAEEMEKRQKEISGLYGGVRGDENFGPDQSTLSDLRIDLGGGVYHSEGSEMRKKSDEEREQDERKKRTGPAWESAVSGGPLFDSSSPGIEFGESLQLETIPDEEEVSKEKDVDITGSMDELLGAADSFREEDVKDAGGGEVLVSAVPMEDQMKMKSEDQQTGPRIPPPGQQPPTRQMPPGQMPPAKPVTKQQEKKPDDNQ